VVLIKLQVNTAVPYKLTPFLYLPRVGLRYEWRKDGLPLENYGLDYKRLPGIGTLVIDSPKETHEGTYQCLAKNELGTALSIKSTLKLAGESS